MTRPSQETALFSLDARLSGPDLQNKAERAMTSLGHLLFSDLITPEDSAVAVAVSGGADSLLLSYALHRYLQKKNVTLVGVSVNHGLRPESAAEARHVGRLFQAWGRAHHTLTLRNLPEKSGQSACRLARYEALASFCHSRHISKLFLGHQADDQIETFLMRLGAGSGPAGWAGMSAQSDAYGLRILRPFLDQPRTWIQKTAEHLGLPFICDPSNQNPRFQRVRVRQAVLGAPKSVRTTALCLQRHCAKKQTHLRHQAATLITQAQNSCDPGGITLNFQRLQSVPPDILVQALKQLLMMWGGRRTRPISTPWLQRWAKKIQDTGTYTLGGCWITRRKNSLTLQREWPRIVPVFVPNLCDNQGAQRRFLWDHRFYLELTSDLPTGPVALRPLGHDRDFRKSHPAHTSFPGLFSGSTLLARFDDARVFRRFQWVHGTVFGPP